MLQAHLTLLNTSTFVINIPCATKHLTNTKKYYKEKLSRILEQLDSYNAWIFDLRTKFEDFSINIIRQIQWQNRQKAFNMRLLETQKDPASKPQWFGLQGLFTKQTMNIQYDIYLKVHLEF